MIDREGTVLGTDLDAAAECQLVGVDLGAQAGPQAGFQHEGGVFDGEEAFFAEDIDEIGVSGGFRHHPAYGSHIIFLGVAAAYRVRAEESNLDHGGGGGFDAVDDAEHFQLIDGIEPVSALDLDGTGALRDHFTDALHRLAVEFVFRGLVQQVGGVEDTAATGGDLFVRKTVDLVEEFPVAAAGIDDVGVTVAEGGHHQAAFAVDDFVGAGRDGRGGIAESGDAPAVHQQPGVGKRSDFVHGRAFLATDACGHDARKRTDVLEQASHLTDIVFRG